MKELNIAATIAKKRKEKKITQEELANYMGVSKASVSKWETGQSYPDVTFLPQLATYFNISIDTLMGYSPQMTKEDIAKLYFKLSKDFTQKPFEDVIAECDNIIKKYYACFPLLTQMVTLLINHHMLSPDKKRQAEILEQSVSLCEHITAESDDIRILNQIMHAQVTCHQFLQQPEKSLALLGEAVYPMIPNTEMMASAYFQLGNTKKADEATQAAMYQHLLAFVGATPMYMSLHSNDLERMETALQRAIIVSDTFQLDNLHPNTTANLYHSAAYIYCTLQKKEEAIVMLTRYEKVCTHFFPYKLREDDFFDNIASWFAEFDLGPNAPRDDKFIKESFVNGIVENPVFDILKDDIRFKNIVKNLKKV